MGVAAVEFARPPSCSPLRVLQLTLDIQLTSDATGGNGKIRPIPVNSCLLLLIALLSRMSGPSIPPALIIGLSPPLVPPLAAPAMFLALLRWCIWHAR